MRPGGSGKRFRSNRGYPRRGSGGGRNQSFESTGPDVKVRGTAQQVADKYLALARDASSAGDPVAAENCLQHAEHYQRIVNQHAERAAEQQRDREDRDDRPDRGERPARYSRGNGAQADHDETEAGSHGRGEAAHDDADGPARQGAAAGDDAARPARRTNRRANGSGNTSGNGSRHEGDADDAAPQASGEQPVIAS